MEEKQPQITPQQLQQQKAALDAREAALTEKEQALKDKKHSPNFNIYERVNVPVKLLEKIILGLLGVMAVVIIAAIVISNL